MKKTVHSLKVIIPVFLISGFISCSQQPLEKEERVVTIKAEKDVSQEAEASTGDTEGALEYL